MPDPITTDLEVTSKVTATLYLHLSNGDHIPATPDHLTALGYANRSDTCALASDWFRRLVDVADTDDLTLAGHMVLHTFANAISCPSVDPNPTAPTGPWSEDQDEQAEAEYHSAVGALRLALAKPRTDKRWPDGFATPKGTEPVR